MQFLHDAIRPIRRGASRRALARTRGFRSRDLVPVPSLQGYVHPKFRRVARALEEQLVREGVGGAAVCVYHRGACVVDLWGGTRDGESGAAWDGDTMALSFSTTKGVMSTLIHLLADRGQLDYDAPVARYWPEFAQNGKKDITVRQVLSHRAGLHAVRPLIGHAREMLDWETMVTAIAAAPPHGADGRRPGYHGITYGWIVGEILRRVSGRSLEDLLRDELAEPLGLDGLYLGAPAAERHRVARLVRPNTELGAGRLAMAKGLAALVGVDPEDTRNALLPDGVIDLFLSDDVLDAHIPAANGVFTARSLARMYAMLSQGGTFEGRRYLSEETLRHATRIQTRAMDKVIGVPLQWRLGYHLVGTSRGIPRSAFGHFGYGGSGAWAWPDEHLSMAMVTNRVAGTPFGDMRLVRLGGATLASLPHAA